MPINWQLFRVACLLQMLLTTYFFFKSLVVLFYDGGFSFSFQTLFFALICIFSVFALNLVNTNYPNQPVIGKQKTWFNWLYLLNFLLLAFLFGSLFSIWRTYKQFYSLFADLVQVPSRLKFILTTTILMLILQFVLLFGLYSLRRLLYSNAQNRSQFEFEENP
jgi:hypothetical protein